jgi:tRNA dimethylallyltransferase
MSSSAGSDDAEASLRTIPVICGPTAAGKSGIAAWLSGRRQLLVISADSRQIYRRFDVGTAKPTVEERDRVPYRGVDVVEPHVRYSAAEWAALARGAIHEAFASGLLPLVVGGTGFYIGALFRPLWNEPELDPASRQALQRALGALTTDELRRWCQALDPARLSELHVARARAAEYSASYLLVDPGMELPTRIAARASAMVDAGWPDEVRHLIETVPEDAPAWKATGYGVVRAYVRGEIDRAAMLKQVLIETRQYAKRQRTWFRHQLARERVQRLVSGAPGWQETVDRWITEVEATMRAQHAT